MTSTASPPRVDPAAVEGALRLFMAPGSVTEIRGFSGGSTWSGYFDSQAKAAKAVARLGEMDGIYFTPSPVCDALLARRANRIKRLDKRDPATDDSLIRQRLWLLLDSDPERPSGISSTDAEHEASIEHMGRLRAGLRERGWPEPILADSGNGAHACYRINLPNDEDSRNLIQRVLQALDALFQDDTCKIDLTVFNAARIWKLYGTRAGKGDSIPDRPHRMARVLEAPDSLSVVTREQLEAIAEFAPCEEKHQGHGATSGNGKGVEAWLKEWIQKHNIQVVDGEPSKIAGDKLRWRLRSCPWNEAHGQDAAIILRPDGVIGARCFHNGCAGKGWKDLRAIFESRNGSSEAASSKKAQGQTSASASREAEPPPPYAPFPSDSLPEPLRSLVEEGARAIGCDAAYIALPALVIAASTIGNSRRVLLKRRWSEPAVLWGAIVGESGTQKSPALALALDPVEDWQAARIRDHKRALKEHEIEKTKYEKDLAEWKKKGCGEPPEKPEEPVCDRMLVREPTMPALAAILETTPRGVVLVRDELAGWFGAMGQYHAGGASADSAYWLEAHRAGPWTIDRKTGAIKILHIPAAAVSVLGGIQPVVLQKALLEGTHYEDGLAPRLLLVCPPRKAKRWSEADIPERTEESVKHVLSRLRKLEMEKVQGEEGDEPWLRATLLRLTDEAKALWVSYYNEHGAEQADLSGALAATWSKLEGYCARFALVFRLVRWANGTDPTPPTHIEAEDMKAAIVMADWFGAEARRVYGILGESAEARRLRELVDWIQDKGGAVTIRDVTQGLRRYRQGHTEEAERDLIALVAAKRGAWETPPGHDGAGRPRPHIFRLSKGRLRFQNSPSPEGNGNSETVATPERFPAGAGEEALRQAGEYQARRPPIPPRAAAEIEADPVWGAVREPGDEPGEEEGR